MKNSVFFSFFLFFSIYACQGKNNVNHPQVIDNNHDTLAILPLDYKNYSEILKFEDAKDPIFQQLVKEKYKLWIDAIAKLPAQGNYDLYLINNMSGDSEVNYLITYKNETIIDGLEISNSYGDSPKTLVFSISENYIVSLFLEKNGKRKQIKNYQLNGDGTFIEK